MAACATLVTLAGCGGSLSVFDAAGEQAARIEFLTHVLIWGLGAIWLGMVALGMVAMIWPRRLPHLSIRAWLIWGGVALPLAVMVPLFVWAVVMTDQLRRGSDAVIRAEAFMWGWQFDYPGGGQTLNLLYLPEGRPVTIEIRSRDVVHSLWIPQLAGKMDAVPGHVTTLPLTATRAGLIEGQCAEFCGLGHTEMRFVVDIRDPPGYETALAGLADGTTPSRPEDMDALARDAAGPGASVSGTAPTAPDVASPAGAPARAGYGAHSAAQMPNEAGRPAGGQP